MEKKDLKKMWQLFLVENNTDTKTVAEKMGIFPQSLGRKINSGALKVLELAKVLELYGYRLELVKDEKKQHQNRYSKKRHKKRPAKWQAFLIVLFAIARSITKSDVAKD